MAEPSPEAPQDKVEIIKVDKRGEYLVCEGVVEGKRVTVEIGAQHEQAMTATELKAFIRRSLYGTKKMEEGR